MKKFFRSERPCCEDLLIAALPYCYVTLAIILFFLLLSLIWNAVKFFVHFHPVSVNRQWHFSFKSARMFRHGAHIKGETGFTIILHRLWSPDETNDISLNTTKWSWKHFQGSIWQWHYIKILRLFITVPVLLLQYQSSQILKTQFFYSGICIKVIYSREDPCLFCCVLLE